MAKAQTKFGKVLNRTADEISASEKNRQERLTANGLKGAILQKEGEVVKYSEKALEIITASTNGEVDWKKWIEASNASEIARDELSRLIKALKEWFNEEYVSTIEEDLSNIEGVDFTDSASTN